MVYVFNLLWGRCMQRPYNTNATSLQYQCNVPTIPMQYPHNTHSISPQYPFNIPTIPIQRSPYKFVGTLHATSLQYQCNVPTIPNAISPQYPFNIPTIPIQRSPYKLDYDTQYSSDCHFCGLWFMYSEMRLYSVSLRITWS